MNEKLLSVKNLKVTYSNKENTLIKAVNDLSLDANKGEIL